MNSVYNSYEAVIGLEVHMQLLTKSKAYSSDSTEYGALPNSQVSVISLGHPGTLPKMNKKVIEFAVKLGLACRSSITPENHFARKNYFYADLPKGYQITQHTTPICTGGFITIKDATGKEKKIQLTRIHMEEDAGKSIHDQDAQDTLIDLNRAGVPLLEMVSEPDIRSGDEAYKYLTEVRRLVRYLDICDGNMEEGSLRCDANISVRKKGAAEFGTKIEVKNMNSIRNVQRAIEHEIKRQVDALEAGEKLRQETRNFDAGTGTTSLMRRKEGADDYRYFPEPDLQPVMVTQGYIAAVKETLPPLPDELFKKYTTEYHLPEYDAGVLTDSKEIALYFEELVSALTGNDKTRNTEPETRNYKLASNWVMGSVKSYLNENAVHLDHFPLRPEKLADLIRFVESGKVSHSAAAQVIFPEMISHPEASPEQIARQKNILQESDENSLNEMIQKAIAKYPEKVAEYRNGKVGLIGLFMGEVMKLSGGKADPKVASRLVKEMLEKQ